MISAFEGDGNRVVPVRKSTYIHACRTWKEAFNISAKDGSEKMDEFRGLLSHVNPPPRRHRRVEQGKIIIARVFKRPSH